jgi:hypothetical protein
MTAVIVAVVAVHSVVAVASAVTAVVTVLNHGAHLALKATEVEIALKAVAIALKTVVHPLLALKVAATRVQKHASSLAPISAANNAALHLAVKPALNPAVISAKRLVPRVALIHAVKTALTHVIAVPHAHQTETMREAVPAIVPHVVLKSWVLAISSHTMPAVMQPPSALAPKC